MSEVTRGCGGREVVRVGVDLAKRVIQVRAVDTTGRVVTSRAQPLGAGAQRTLWLAKGGGGAGLHDDNQKMH